MTTYTDEISIYNTDAIQDGIDDAHDAYKSVITEVGSTGVKVHPSGQSGSGIVDYTLVDANGTHVYKGGDDVAMFGSTARIGKASGESRMELDYHSLKLIDREGDTYFHVGDLREEDGSLDVSDWWLADGERCDFFLSNTANSTGYTVKVDGTTVTSGILKTQVPNQVLDGAEQRGHRHRPVHDRGPIREVAHLRHEGERAERRRRQRGDWRLLRCNRAQVGRGRVEDNRRRERRARVREQLARERAVLSRDGRGRRRERQLRARRRARRHCRIRLPDRDGNV